MSEAPHFSVDDVVRVLRAIDQKTAVAAIEKTDLDLLFQKSEILAKLDSLLDRPFIATDFNILGLITFLPLQFRWIGLITFVITAVISNTFTLKDLRKILKAMGFLGISRIISDGQKATGTAQGKVLEAHAWATAMIQFTNDTLATGRDEASWADVVRSSRAGFIEIRDIAEEAQTPLATLTQLWLDLQKELVQETE